MFKTLITSIRMIWLGAETKSLKFRVVVNTLCGIGCGFTMYFSSFYLAELVRVVTAGNTAGITKYLYIFTGLALGLVVLRFIFRYACEFMGLNIANNLRRHYFTKMFYKDYAWHTQNSVGFFSSMLERVTSRVFNWTWQMPYDYLPGFVMIILFMYYTSTVSIWLLWYFVACMGFIIIGIWIALRPRMRMNRKKMIADRAYYKLFMDFLYNIRTVKKLNLLTFTRSKIIEYGQDVEGQNKKIMHYNAYQWGFLELFIRAQFLLPLTYFIFQLIKTGDGIDIIVMLVSVQSQMGEIGRQIMHFMTELASSKPEFELFTEHLGDAALPEQRPYNKKWKQIKFDKTKFTFIDDETDFAHVVENFEINRGDHIAVMGKSGEGKSTFLNLVTRQFVPQSGRILVDDTEYNQIPQSFFDNEITYVSQDVEMFDMSLYDNITMGQKISKRRMQDVIDGCCLNELINRLNGNMNANIGEKGTKISGGEKQRINLARGLLMNRPILVLDEITANLDPETTRHIWKYIFKEHKDKTIIAISHEPELVRHVNKKLVFRRGMGRMQK